MTTQPTPGPWEAQYTVVIGPDSEVIADTSCKGARQAPRDTQKANARLIAGAPQLRDELRALLEWVEAETDGRDWPHERLEAARALLRDMTEG